MSAVRIAFGGNQNFLDTSMRLQKTGRNRVRHPHIVMLPEVVHRAVIHQEDYAVRDEVQSRDGREHLQLRAGIEELGDGHANPITLRRSIPGTVRSHAPNRRAVDRGRGFEYDPLTRGYAYHFRHAG